MKFCRKCFAVVNLTRHHILPTRIFGKNNKQKDLADICRDCHSEYEEISSSYLSRSEKYYREKFEEWVKRSDQMYYKKKNDIFLRGKIILVHYSSGGKWEFKITDGLKNAFAEAEKLLDGGHPEAEFTCTTFDGRRVRVDGTNYREIK